MLQSIKQSARYLSFLALKEILFDQRFSNNVVDYYLKKNNLKDADQRLFTNLVYGITFYNLRLNYELSSFLSVKKTDPATLLIIKIAIYQMYYLERIPDYAAVNEAIEIAKIVNCRDVKFVTAVLHQTRRKGLRSIDDIKDPVKRQAIKYSLPDWVVQKLNSELGTKKTSLIFDSVIKKPRISLRVNTKKISQIELLTRHSDFQASNISSVGVISKTGNVIHRSDFQEGYYTIQDESSQLVAPNLLLEKNDIVLDACAAPGGKTTHIAQYLDSSKNGMVHAFDLSEKKCALIEENVKRLGLEDVVKIHLGDVTKIQNKMPGVYFDKILVDAPCSGFGLLRRKPEVKYNHETSDIISSSKIQLKILDSVAPSLKAGGLLLYSTCTIFKEETQDVVLQFLAKHLNFVLINLSVKPQRAKESMLQIYPDDYLTDGFFMALMQKQEA